MKGIKVRKINTIILLLKVNELLAIVLSKVLMLKGFIGRKKVGLKSNKGIIGIVALIVVCISLAIGINFLEYKYQFYCDFNKAIELYIMAIGYTGVLLGLYYNSYNALLTNRYKDTPSEILNELNSISLSRNTIRLLIFSILYLVVNTCIYVIGWGELKEKIGVLSLIAVIFLLISITMYYQTANNKTVLEYTNLFKLSEDHLAKIMHIIKTLPKGYVECLDINNSIHRREREKADNLFYRINIINSYNIKINNDSKREVEHISILLNAIFIYGMYKWKIAYNSEWFPQKETYVKYYDVDITRYEIANRSKSLPLNERQQEFDWLEKRIANLMHDIYRHLLERKDYSGIILYLEIFSKLIPERIYDNVGSTIFDIVKKQFKIFVSTELTGLSDEIKKNAIYESFAVVLETISLSMKKTISDIDYIAEINTLISIIKNQSENNIGRFINNEKCYNVYMSASIEKVNENRIITPDRYIIEVVADQINSFFNSILILILDIYKFINEAAKNEGEHNRTYSASILYYICVNYINKMRGIEYIIGEKINAINENYSLNMLNDSQNKFESIIKSDYGEIIRELGKNVDEYIINKRDKTEREEPDFFGYYINESINYLVGCIEKDDFNEFCKTYEKYIEKILHYHKYIIKDIANKSYSELDALNFVLTPFNKYYKISGMALIYGILIDDTKWIDIVNKEFEAFYNSQDGKTIIDYLVKYLNNKHISKFSYLNTDFYIDRAFTEVINKYIVKFVENHGIYGDTYKTKDDLLNKYLNNKYNSNMNLEDTEEFYIIKVINNRIGDKNKYISDSGWEENESD